MYEKIKGEEYPGQFSRTKMEDFLYYTSRPTIKLQELKLGEISTKINKYSIGKKKHSVETNLYITDIFYMWQRWHYKSVEKATFNKCQ